MSGYLAKSGDLQCNDTIRLLQFKLQQRAKLLYTKSANIGQSLPRLHHGFLGSNGSNFQCYANSSKV